MAQQWAALAFLPEDIDVYSQHPHVDPQPSITPVPKDPTLISGFCGHTTCTWYSNTHASTNMHKVKLKQGERHTIVHLC